MNTIELTNPTEAQLTEAIETVQMRAKTEMLGPVSASVALETMRRYTCISMLDVRGGSRVAHAYKYPHVATGMILRRNDNGDITVTVSRKPGNDLARWAIVHYSPDAKDLLKTELGMDRYNQIDSPLFPE